MISIIYIRSLFIIVQIISIYCVILQTLKSVRVIEIRRIQRPASSANPPIMFNVGLLHAAGFSGSVDSEMEHMPSDSRNGCEYK